MRGSLQLISDGVLKLGIIPAHAGLTSPAGSAQPGRRDHPRACGAHICCRVGLGHVLGSSPRMRGSPIPIQAPPYVNGIIPAHAGLTEYFAFSRRRHGDHPRACGAHASSRYSRLTRQGSSPRMRGSRSAFGVACAAGGIIPAHAGLTLVEGINFSDSWDHPRACGAHQRHCCNACVLPGSSPRMRGSQTHNIDGHFGARIIPAHAGLTLKNPNIDAILSGPHPVFYSFLRVIR